MFQEDEERKRAEQIRKKLEAKQLLEDEMKEISKSIQPKIPLAKITRSQVVEEVERRNRNIEALAHPPKPVSYSVQMFSSHHYFQSVNRNSRKS
jgi:hypothetical protein